MVRKEESLKVVPTKPEARQDFELSLDEVAREGAKRMLIEALNLEVEEYIQAHKGEVDENGRRLVVRNGGGFKVSDGHNGFRLY